MDFSAGFALNVILMNQYKFKSPEKTWPFRAMLITICNLVYQTQSVFCFDRSKLYTSD